MDPNTVEPPDMAAHAGSPAYSIITPFRMPPSESPDDEVSKIPPPGVVIIDPVEELGDTRLCSAVCIEDISCDSVDCAPVPVDALAAWALCAANPAWLVVCGAAVNGVTFAVVAAEFAA